MFMRVVTDLSLLSVTRFETRGSDARMSLGLGWHPVTWLAKKLARKRECYAGRMLSADC
jgi:hypothetical protein